MTRVLCPKPRERTGQDGAARFGSEAHHKSSLPMGRDFVGLARALRWAGPGSSGWAHYKSSWAGSGRESPKPGLPGEPDECFTLCS